MAGSCGYHTLLLCSIVEPLVGQLASDAGAGLWYANLCRPACFVVPAPSLPRPPRPTHVRTGRTQFSGLRGSLNHHCDKSARSACRACAIRVARSRLNWVRYVLPVAYRLTCNGASLVCSASHAWVWPRRRNRRLRVS